VWVCGEVDATEWRVEGVGTNLLDSPLGAESSAMGVRQFHPLGRPLGPMDVVVLLYDGFDNLDAIGPFEVFNQPSASVQTSRSGSTRSRESSSRTTASASSPTACSLRARPGRHPRRRMGRPPGGHRAASQRGSTVGAVCTGGMLLARAGLTDGRPRAPPRRPGRRRAGRVPDGVRATGRNPPRVSPPDPDASRSPPHSPHRSPGGLRDVELRELVPVAKVEFFDRRRRLLAGGEDDAVCHLLGFDHLAGLEGLLHRAAVTAFDLRADLAQVDHRDGDARLAEPAREAEHEPAEPPLRGGVGSVAWPAMLPTKIMFPSVSQRAGSPPARHSTCRRR
jgi:hypothetical protein